MQLSMRGLIISLGLIWGGAILCVGLVHLAIPSYGASFLEVVSSIYPGFHGARSVGDSFIGAGYALIDGGLGGFFVGWLYNACARRGPSR
jgi:hypothetical protein